MSCSPWFALRRVAFAVVVFAAFFDTRARAAEASRPLSEAVTVEPGATCIDAATLVEHVQSWLGTDTVDADFAIDVRGSPSQARVVTFRTLRGGRVIAFRRFDPGPERCEHLHAALGLAIAMALKASLIDEVAPTAGPASAPPTSVVTPAAPREIPPPWAVAANALAALAILPDPAFGADVRVERALTPSLSARFELLALLALGETFQGSPGHFDTWLLAPRLDLCAGVEATRRFRAHGCMGASGGEIHAQGSLYPSSRATSIGWLAVANELGVTVDLTRRWSLDADAALVLPVIRESIVLRDYSGSVLQQRNLASVGWVFGVGPLFRF